MWGKRTLIAGLLLAASGCASVSATPEIEVEVVGIDPVRDAERVIDEAFSACDIGWVSILMSEPNEVYVTIIGPGWENKITVDCDTGDITERT